ncbi:MAG TPA: ATP-binding protein, partial [Pyrinomonadaceae bacterium]|nr:ATP-binding protein [Pyrinomonadaceae bacterium]
MDREDYSNLLPPLSSLDEVPEGFEQVQEATTARRPLLKLTDEEFERALKGDVAFEGTLKVHDGEGTRATATAKAKVVEVTLPESVLEAFAEAAALRYTYRLDALTPLETRGYQYLSREERDQVFNYLTARSEIVSDARLNTRWMLRDEVRRAALQRLIEKNALLRAVEQARADCDAELRQASSIETKEELPASRVEETLWEFLTKPQTSAGYERRQLFINQRVVEWVYGLPGVTVPSPADVNYQLAKETLLQPFRHLTGEWKDGKFVSNFKGREEELSRIYDYLAVLPPPSWGARLQRFVRRLSDTTWSLVNRTEGHRPLLIHGLGGVGKSTLLAKFFLDHLTETDPAARFPYAYLDCDSTALSVLEPLTLLTEAGRQLATQYPASEPAWNEARNAWIAKTVPGTSYRIDVAYRTDAINEFRLLLLNSEAGGISVAEQFKRGLPFLLVLDTFEEVQYRDRDGIKDVFRLLNIMRSLIPNLHIIMMGRAPLGDIQREYADIESFAVESDAFGTGEATDFNVIEVELGDLEESKAREYLQDQGISDPKLAEELVSIVGGNPLSLRLMVNVFKKGGLDLKSLREETEWRPSWGAWFRGQKVPPKALLQGVLFDRILGHIHDKKVKKLAHPGLTLRRITPKLIQEVLAEPCGLGKIDYAEAEVLFWELANEITLVGTERDPSGELVIQHRPEIRKIMLRLMEADEEMREQIQKVHENAIDFYEREGQEDREEALYHRLMSGKRVCESDYLEDVPTGEALDAGYAVPTAELNLMSIWLRLSNSSDELPLAGKAYLAARLKEDTISDEEWAKVDRQDWELSIL